MKLKKVVSQLCSMNEHECCEPRWVEDDESGLPTHSCRCVCPCHEPDAARKGQAFRDAVLISTKNSEKQ